MRRRNASFYEAHTAELTVVCLYRANEVSALQNKKTIMPADVFRALDDIEYGFMRERVEAEFASAPLLSPHQPPPPPSSSSFLPSIGMF